MEKSLKTQRSRLLRKNSTDVEKQLWYYLRAHRLGYKFKRQVPIENYIVDFICHEKRLIIELDTGQHQEMAAYDERRTKALNKKGFKVLRFWNHDVLQNIGGVLEVIRHALSKTLFPRANS